jgi:TetR/AcrR family transcriptional repressor of nem operon
LNREALVTAASRLFQAQGFAATGVAQISEEAGLTQGGFYRHFKSKSLLAQAACQQSLDRCHDEWVAMKGSGADDLSTLIDAYVSAEHVDNVADGCPMSAYTCEIKSQDAGTQQIFTLGFDDMTALLEETLVGDIAPEDARRIALFFMSSMVGSVALARATKRTDPQRSEQILAATRDSLKAMAAHLRTAPPSDVAD